MRRLVFPLLIGLAGFALLASLGVWQLQRLAWKEGILARIDARIAAAPVALPIAPDAAADRYLPVRVEGRTTGETIPVLISLAGRGAGYRAISAFETDGGRRILIDEGFISQAQWDGPLPATSMTVTGNLHWPEEVDGFTPEPDRDAGIWFARDLPALAAELNTEPVLVVARTVTGTDARATPIPVEGGGIPNNHLGYAIQWFGLAAVWAAMTAFWIARSRTEEPA